MEPLILDEKALQNLGLHHQAIYTVEYDLPRSSVKFDKKTNQFLRSQRNKMTFMLKYKLRAIKNLDSSWFIDEKVLDKTEAFLNLMKHEYLNHKPSFNMDKRIRIIPILTTTEGFESYEDKKVEFLLQFLNESLEKVEKGLSDEIMSETILWRCKKSIEIVESISDSLKQHAQHKLIQDTLIMLADSINKYENLKQDKKEQKKIQKKQK